MPPTPEAPTRPRAASLLLLMTAAGLSWAYWPTLDGMIRKWDSDPQYSHGFLVVPFALFLLWTWRDRLPPLSSPSPWGLALLAFGTALRLAGARFYFEWFEGASLVPSLAGLLLLVGGRPALRWAW